VVTGLLQSWLSLDRVVRLILARRLASTRRGASSLGSHVRVMAYISGLSYGRSGAHGSRLMLDWFLQ